MPWILTGPASAGGIQIDSTTGALAPHVYIDCRGGCDMSFIRQELAFINHVRDQALADVHVFITNEPTGSGGRVFTLSLTGRNRFEHLNTTLTFTADQTATDHERREGLLETLKLGLVPYLSQTHLAERLRVTFIEPSKARAIPLHDPWKNWVFEAYGGGNFSMESTRSAVNIRYGIFADRVTEAWKIRLRPYFNYNTRTFRSGDDIIHTVQRRDGLISYIIKSLGEHWGAGIFGDYITSTFDNFRHRVRLRPAVEYSYFPYAEASRREVTFSYQIGYEEVDYIDETIYGQEEETLLNQELSFNIRLRQPWGSVSSSISGSHYLHDIDHYRLRLDTSVSFRLVRGVSLNVSANFQRIHDQLALPRGDATLEQILLQQRRLATSYSASGSLGLSYTFGSIYSNVVNPRL